jgi:FkbM family methyltransferase
MFFARKERIWIYAKGIQKRVEKLGEVYSLKHCNLTPDDTVIDCGANIGEFSALVHGCYGSTVIAVEPEATEARCIPFNVPGVHDVINAALWHEETELKFFSKNRSADSSIFETDGYDKVIIVPTLRLDDLLDRYGLDQIKLFKLEAEGAEPEILLGATRALPHIEFISADLGPERGLAQESTVIPVCNHLFKSGFELVSLYHKRQVYLFRNTRIKTKI